MKKIVFILAPSGAGKSYLEAGLAEYDAEMYHKAISVTSREPRVKDNEVHGVNYFFRNKEEILNSKDSLVELTEFKGNLYGLEQDQIVDDKITIVVIEPNGLVDAMNWADKNHVSYMVIFLNIDKKILEDNMRERGDTEESIESRLNDGIVENFYSKRIQPDLEIKTKRDDLVEYCHNSIQGHFESLVKEENIRAAIKKVDRSKITVLVGKNASGKSLLRKQQSFKVKSDGGTLIHYSMQLRTESNPMLGALSNFAHDMPDSATSFETFKGIQSSYNTAKKEEKNFLVIDEPEIGMSEETILAVVNWMNKHFDREVFPNGVMVITHSRVVVEHLKADAFVNISDLEMTKEEWLNRKIEPADLDALERNAFFSHVLNLEKRMKNKLR